MKQLILFVQGGTIKSRNSNAMKETSQQLGPYEFQDATYKEFDGLTKKGTLAQFQEFFDKCQKHDVHMTNVDGVVYRSSQFSFLIGLIIGGNPAASRPLTKSLGLRDAIVAQQEREGL